MYPWNDIRTKFGYTMLVAIRLRGRHYEKLFKEKDFIIYETKGE